MLFPAGMSPFDEDVWGVVLTFDQSGYVSDADAAGHRLRHARPTEMRDGDRARECRAQGTGLCRRSTSSAGLRQPRYDAKTHKLYWAKELAFEGEPI